MNYYGSLDHANKSCVSVNGRGKENLSRRVCSNQDVSLCPEIGKTTYMSDPLILAYDTVSNPVLGATMIYN